MQSPLVVLIPDRGNGVAGGAGLLVAFTPPLPKWRWQVAGLVTLVGEVLVKGQCHTRLLTGDTSGGHVVL